MHHIYWVGPCSREAAAPVKASSTTTETSQRGVGRDADYITTHLLLRVAVRTRCYAALRT
jgi:hypothetical protein